MANIPDVAIPVLGFALIFHSVYNGLKEGIKWEHIIKVAAGIAIMGFSIYASITSSEQTNILNSNVSTLLEQRKTDSINNASFQKYLKDTFGIIKQGSKPIVYNTKVYLSQVKELKNAIPDSQAQGLSDSLNYVAKLNTANGKTILSVYPKEGVWAKPFIYYDSSTVNKNPPYMVPEYFDGIGTPGSIKVIFNRKAYMVAGWYFNTPVSYLTPLEINITGDKDQYIIFGDQINLRKSYIYRKGTVKWIPN